MASIADSRTPGQTGRQDRLDRIQTGHPETPAPARTAGQLQPGRQDNRKTHSLSFIPGQHPRHPRHPPKTQIPITSIRFHTKIWLILKKACKGGNYLHLAGQRHFSRNGTMSGFSVKEK